MATVTFVDETTSGTRQDAWELAMNNVSLWAVQQRSTAAVPTSDGRSH
ncbi:hypothetical protein [Streptomyces sp. NPDC002205]